MYGQTEATARMSYLPPQYAVSKAGSIGIAIPGGKFWLEDENGQIIQENNTVGELVYKGDNVTLGYAENCYDLSKGDDNGGILRTGDLAQRDNDGFYYIVGRNKRFLKLFGNRININEIEQLINDKGFNCVCAGTDNNLKIYVTEQGKQNEIKAFISELTGINPTGFTVHYIEEIPRNNYGKVIYSLLDKYSN
jgi:acyl-coenzyme A synthetase/AMP-(fatty) acid ligase